MRTSVSTPLHQQVNGLGYQLERSAHASSRLWLAGEEVVNPKRSIPLSIIITLGVVSTLYCFLSGVITLMVPYYLVDTDTPLPLAFEYAGLVWARYVVTVGAVISLSTW